VQEVLEAQVLNKERAIYILVGMADGWMHYDEELYTKAKKIVYGCE
jgi:hypothetical protein